MQIHSESPRTTIPAAIRDFASLSSEGELHALLTCGTQEKKDLGVIDQNQSYVSGTCNFGPSLSQADITLEFVFDSTVYGKVYPIASATKTYINGAKPEINFVMDDYTFQDNDADGLSNLQELQADTLTSPDVGEYTVGGTVYGLSGNIGLRNNDDASDEVVLSGSGEDLPFTFAKRIADGGAYTVDVSQQPANMSCVVEDGQGQVSGHVNNIRVQCGYQIQVTIEGLLGSGLTLQNNNADPLNIDSDGIFTFSQRAASGDDYSISVFQAPQNPQQDCQPVNGSGQVANSDVNIKVTCTDNLNPTVLSTQPASGATDVALDALISASFSEPMANSSLDTSSFSVQGGGSVLAGSVSSDGNAASFTPASALQIATSYTATLAASISDLSGNNLGADYPWSFLTRDGIWSQPSTPQVSGTINDFTAAVTDNGNVGVVWNYSDGSTSYLAVRDYDSNLANWSDVQSTAHASQVRGMHIRPNGDVVVISENSSSQLTARQFTTAWEASETVISARASNPNGFTVASYYPPNVSANNLGNVMVVWSESDVGSTFEIRSNLFTGSGWGPYSTFVTSSIDGLRPELVLDDSSNALVIWDAYNNVGDVAIFALRFDSINGWDSQAVQLNSRGDNRSMSFYRIFMDDNGNALAFWSQNGFNSMSANYFDRNSGAWLTQQMDVAPDGAVTLNAPSVAFDADGNALAIWVVPGTANTVVMASYFSQSQKTWTSPETIRTPTLSSIDSLLLKFNQSGQAIAAWREQNTGTYWVKTFSNNSWQGQPVEFTDANSAGQAGANIVLDQEGNVMLGWLGNDGSFWVRRQAQGVLGNAALSISENASPASNIKMQIDSKGRITAIWQANGQMYMKRFE
ncbi:MAG: Ig-like domain-containing protein [Gammaproteobacteria bacterium]